MKRIINLSGYDLDYAAIGSSFKDLARLSAKIAGTGVSQINLLDAFTQWSIATYGIDGEQIPKEDTVCQYTIQQSGVYEVNDLSADERFRDKDYVAKGPALRYYYGIPLTSPEGLNLGSLCVLDKKQKQVTSEKAELLAIIANEIINRLQTYKIIDALGTKAEEAIAQKHKAAHDIRGPLAGIIGLSEIIHQQVVDRDTEETAGLVKMINDSGQGLLDLADEILQTRYGSDGAAFTLAVLQQRLERLYLPQAVAKNIQLDIIIQGGQNTPLKKSKLLQITGNLVSNAVKFTPPGGHITVTLCLETDDMHNNLIIQVQDDGIGMQPANVQAILEGHAASTAGTAGEDGYGFGLALVKQLIDKLGGTLSVQSVPGQGALFTVSLPQRAL